MAFFVTGSSGVKIVRASVLAPHGPGFECYTGITQRPLDFLDVLGFTQKPTGPSVVSHSPARGQESHEIFSLEVAAAQAKEEALIGRQP